MKNITPKHIGIIMDGNRRFAKKLMKQPWKGHEYGAQKVKSVLRWAKSEKIKEITLYILSLDNFNRPKKEFDMLMNLFEKELKDEQFNKEIESDKIKINVIGQIKLLPENIQKLLKNKVTKTQNNNKLILNLAIAYSGREEIIDAIKDIVKDALDKKININNIKPELLNGHLSLQREPEMIIRTGGEKRLSDFLIWQSTYSELFFTDTLWPDFTEDEFKKMIDDFTKRKRKFGR